MQNNNEKLAHGKIFPLLLQLSFPAITAQIINALYNMVDRMYIGRIAGVGETALTGVGLCFPIIMIITAFSSLFAMGGAPLVSIKMGEKKKDEAEKIMGGAFGMLVMGAAVLTLFFFLFKDKLLYAFGASSATFPYANSYLSIYLIGTIFVQITMGMNYFVTAQGFAKTAMMTTLIGAVLNIVLDPILIFGFNMGVQGAAIATIFSQSISTVWVIWFLCSKKSTLNIKLKYFVPSAKNAWHILSLGVSPFVMQATESFVLISFTSTLQRFGSDRLIAVITILSSCMQLLLMPLTGFTQGAQPIISYNYGAKNYARVKQCIRYAIILGVSFSTIVWIIAQFFPQLLIMLFTNEASLIEIAKPQMRIFFLSTCLFGIQLVCQNAFLAMGNAKTSVFIACLRKIILLIPLILILPNFLGAEGVFIAEPVSDFISVCVTAILFTLFVKKALSSAEQEPIQGK